MKNIVQKLKQASTLMVGAMMCFLLTGSNQVLAEDHQGNGSWPRNAKQLLLDAKYNAIKGLFSIDHDDWLNLLRTPDLRWKNEKFRSLREDLVSIIFGLEVKNYQELESENYSGVKDLDYQIFTNPLKGGYSILSPYKASWRNKVNRSFNLVRYENVKGQIFARKPFFLAYSTQVPKNVAEDIKTELVRKLIHEALHVLAIHEDEAVELSSDIVSIMPKVKFAHSKKCENNNLGKKTICVGDNVIDKEWLLRLQKVAESKEQLKEKLKSDSEELLEIYDDGSYLVLERSGSYFYVDSKKYVLVPSVKR